MTKKRILVVVSVLFLFVLFSVLLLWLSGKLDANYRKGFYSLDLGTIYYDPVLGADVSHTFVVSNPFSDAIIKLDNPIKTCGCIVSSQSAGSIQPMKTAEIFMTFRTDLSSVRRSEMIFYKTGVEKMPVIQLELKADTIPLLDIDISQYVPPRLKLSERITFPVKGIAYVDNKADLDNVKMHVDGIGFALDSVSHTVIKIDKKYKVMIEAVLSCSHERSDVLSFAQNYGVIVLNANGLKTEKDIHWTPIFPFQVTPTSVYLSQSVPKQIALEFDNETRIKTVIPEYDFLQVHLESARDGKNHIITLQLKENNQMRDEAVITNVIVHLDHDIFPHIRIPVFVLK